jgi:hypothetical protein
MTDRQLSERRMDEVEVMTRAGESVGKAVGTGIRAARIQAVRAGQVSAEAAAQVAAKAEHKLAERGVTADSVRSVLAERADLLAGKAEEFEKSTRKSRKKLAKQRKQFAKKTAATRADLLSRAEEVRKEVNKTAQLTRKQAKGRAKEIRKAAKKARKDFAGSVEPQQRRRWPWVLGLLVAGVVAGYVALTRRPEEIHLHDEDAPTTPATADVVVVAEDEAVEVVDVPETQAARNGQVTDRQI